jgi:hypothetical protein
MSRDVIQVILVVTSGLVIWFGGYMSHKSGNWESKLLLCPKWIARVTGFPGSQNAIAGRPVALQVGGLSIAVPILVAWLLGANFSERAEVLGISSLVGLGIAGLIVLISEIWGTKE